MIKNNNMASAMIPIAGHNAPKGSVKKKEEKRDIRKLTL